MVSIFESCFLFWFEVCIWYCLLCFDHFYKLPEYVFEHCLKLHVVLVFTPGWFLKLCESPLYNGECKIASINIVYCNYIVWTIFWSEKWVLLLQNITPEKCQKFHLTNRPTDKARSWWSVSQKVFSYSIKRNFKKLANISFLFHLYS